jgi:hypothetical protein
MVKIDFRKRDFILVGFFVVLMSAGLGYAFGSTNGPDVMGHTASEILLDDDFCRNVTGYACGVLTDDVDFCDDVLGHSCGTDDNDGGRAIALAGCSASTVTWGATPSAYPKHCTSTVPASTHSQVYPVSYNYVSNSWSCSGSATAQCVNGSWVLSGLSCC